MSFTRLGDKYILDKKTVRMICEGDSWPHMPGSDGCPTLSQLLLVPKETRGGAELTTDQVRTIMKKLADGEPAKPIAREYNVHFVTISDIKLGRAWASLTGKDGNPTIEQMKYAKPLCKHTAKLTEGMANEAKKRLSDGQSARYIAKLLGVTVGAIYHIKQGRTWKNVPDA